MKALVYKVKSAVSKIALPTEWRRKTVEKDEEKIQTDYVVKEDAPDAKTLAESKQVMAKVLPYGLSDVLDDDYEILEKVPQEKVREKAKEIIKDDIPDKGISCTRLPKKHKKARPAKSGVGIVSKTSQKTKNTAER